METVLQNVLYVELYVFLCPAWGIGAEDIVVHNGAAFPTFLRAFPSIGRVFLTSDMQDCTSLTRVSIPLQMATSTSSYFIEINSVSGRIEWVHIAEVRFSDKSTSTESITGEIIATRTYYNVLHSSHYTNYYCVDSASTSSFPSNINSSETITPTPSLATQTMATILTPVIHSNSTVPDPIVTTSHDQVTPISDAVSTTQFSSSPYTLGALVGVVVSIALFIIILMGVVITMCFWRRRRRRRRRRRKTFDKHTMMNKDKVDGMELNTHSLGTITFNNSNYEQMNTKSDINKQPPPLAVSTGEDTVGSVLPADGAMREKGPPDVSSDQVTKITEASASKVGDLESNQLIDSQHTVDHCIIKEKHCGCAVITHNNCNYEQTHINSDINKQLLPRIEHAELLASSTTPCEAEGEVSYSLAAKNVPKKPLKLSKDVGGQGGERKEVQNEEKHTPKYISVDIKHSGKKKRESKDPVSDTVYSERLQPSMFAKPPEQALEKKEEVKEDLADHRTEKIKEEGEEEVEDVYAPIYSLPTALESSSTVLQFKPENIHRIKTLGTGYFGKVLLADTVGLSLKELKMSETDDDKSKSVRIAVKTLRLNPSEKRRDTFDKELKFMSRLNHPNVVCTLGACMVDTPFIVMEYMEKGDLNGYLQDFDTIEQGSAPPTDLTISVGTLVSMSSQIADAMKYLASRNYIHRDLATRNCLVGPESRIKIADFGMSKSLYESHYYTIKGHVVLPVRWMAKECFYGKFSAKTDVWAFGVTMWEIFTLAKDIPYEDMDDSEVAADASRREGDRQLLQRSSDCPPEVYDVMMMWIPAIGQHLRHYMKL